MRIASGLMAAAGAIWICACSSPSSPDRREFHLSGTIFDSASSRRIADATIDVTSGPLAGRSTTSDASGRFGFRETIPVTPPTVLLVQKAGFQPLAVEVNRTDTDIALSPVVKFALEGNYTITFTAADECSMLPSSLRRRTYSSTNAVARLLPRPVFTIELGEADFFPELRILSVAIVRDIGTFFVNSYEAEQRWMDDLPLYERLRANEYLSLHGQAAATMSTNDTAFTATFDGVISYCPTSTDSRFGVGYPPECAVPAVECRSDHHQLTGSQR